MPKPVDPLAYCCHAHRTQVVSWSYRQHLVYVPLYILCVHILRVPTDCVIVSLWCHSSGGSAVAQLGLLLMLQ